MPNISNTPHGLEKLAIPGLIYFLYKKWSDGRRLKDEKEEAELQTEEERGKKEEAELALRSAMRENRANNEVGGGCMQSEKNKRNQKNTALSFPQPKTVDSSTQQSGSLSGTGNARFLGPSGRSAPPSCFVTFG
jgi:hypothetical protein